MKKFMKLFVCAFLAIGTVEACSSTPDVQDNLGVVQLNVTNVPTSVQCLKATAVDSVRTVVKDVPIVNGVTDTTPLQGMPTGDVTIGAAAYDTACSNVTAYTVATWLSDPITQVVQLIQGQPYNLSFTLRPNGDVQPGVDWVSDTTTPTGCVFTYDGNGDAGTGLTQDPCKLFSGPVVAACQTSMDCIKNAGCALTTNQLCQNSGLCSLATLFSVATNDQLNTLANVVNSRCGF